MRDSLNLNEVKILSVLMLGEAYGLEIIKQLNKLHEKTMYLGSLYTILSRLEKKGFVKSWWGEETDERGGNRRKYYRITGSGELAIKKEQQTLINLWGLEISFA